MFELCSEKDSCVLPQYPENGIYDVIGPTTQVSPGERVSTYTQIAYSCNDNYNLVNQGFAVCQKDGSWGEPVRCEGMYYFLIQHQQENECHFHFFKRPFQLVKWRYAKNVRTVYKKCPEVSIKEWQSTQNWQGHKTRTEAKDARVLCLRFWHCLRVYFTQITFEMFRGITLLNNIFTEQHIYNIERMYVFRQAPTLHHHPLQLFHQRLLELQTECMYSIICSI